MSRIGWVVLILVAGFLIALAAFNSGDGSFSEEFSNVWNEETTLGNSEAENKFVNYTDVTCPHCANFHNTIEGSPFESEYIDSGKVFMEVRVTSLLNNANSARANEAAYCAIDQGEFWGFYDNIVQKFTEDYFDKGIGVSPTSPRIPELSDEYYYEAAEGTDVDVDELKSCLDEGDMKDRVNESTQRAVMTGVQGVPYFNVNDGKHAGSGFGGGYDTVLYMLRAGGVK